MTAFGNDGRMPKYTVMIFTRAHEGHETEFDQWSEDTHVDDVLATAGVDRDFQIQGEVIAG